MTRGKLIAIEGIDGAGTTTQAKLLVQWLQRQDHATFLTCEPSRGPVGELLRQVLTHQVRQMDPAAIALLFAADRLHHLRAEILPQLERGALVVTDRYVYSSLAYQGAQLDPAWVATVNARAVEPDLTIYLRVSAEVAQRRRDSRGAAAELFDATELQRRICALYDSIFGSKTNDGSWRMDPAGSGWIRADPAGSKAAAEPVIRAPEQWAVLDGTQDVDPLMLQIRGLVGAYCDHAVTAD